MHSALAALIQLFLIIYKAGKDPMWKKLLKMFLVINFNL